LEERGLAVELEDMGWTAEEAAMMRRIDPALRDRVHLLLENTPDADDWLPSDEDISQANDGSDY
jgi:hypothetical protein